MEVLQGLKIYFSVVANRRSLQNAREDVEANGVLMCWQRARGQDTLTLMLQSTSMIT